MPPEIDLDFCIGCGICVAVCPQNILGLKEGRATVLNPNNCTICGKCLKECPARAVTLNL
jgi:NAD-dependent dihydropyrimidine dehydrogenase PreA subunit